jgi:rare lipoprotein A
LTLSARLLGCPDPSPDGLFLFGCHRAEEGKRRGGADVVRLMLLLLCLSLALVLMPGAVSPAKPKSGKVLRGHAVYYAGRYKGRRMACGGRYHPNKMVAAHRSLACGTRLSVRTIRGEEVVVRVTDRGPFGNARTILDLSRRAARRLGYIDTGRAWVRAEVLGRPR